MTRTLFDPPEPAGPGDSPLDHSGGAHSGPLADRMRPRTLADVVGQDAVVGEHGFLRRAIAEDRVPSCVFWGPPGSGKTTIARIIANETSCAFVPFSAVTSGIKAVKEVMTQAARLRRAQGKPCLLFVDEIHRFNRAQQDAFLPYVERGDIILIGATTENPSFQINAALLSRCRVIVLDPLGSEDLRRLLRRALENSQWGLGQKGVAVADDALDAVSQLASGDARKALNLLEMAVEDASGLGVETVDAASVTALSQRKVLLYDRSGEEHFNLISALHKSLRESDPDAAIYWLARMLAAGEEPLYLARRMIRFASEDVGLADPQALPQALAAWETFHKLGSPEGEIALAQAALYLALAPKSNSVYSAYGRARRTIEERPADPVPLAIRNAPTQLMKDVGYGRGHVYAHQTDEGMGGMECLPDALSGSRFFTPGTSGFEAELSERLERFRAVRARIKSETDGKT